MIGRELAHRDSLLEWFLSQNHRTVAGFTRAVFSGLTTLELARVVSGILRDHPILSGLYHVASSPISKCALLSLVRDVYNLDVAVEPHDSVVCDRSLCGDRFAARTGYAAPPWDEMVREMFADSTPYSEWRAHAQCLGGL